MAETRHPRIASASAGPTETRFDQSLKLLSSSGERRALVRALGAAGLALGAILGGGGTDAAQKNRKNGKSKSKTRKDKSKQRKRNRGQNASRATSQAIPASCCGRESCAPPTAGSNRGDCDFSGQTIAGRYTGANLSGIDGRGATLAGNASAANFFQACLQQATITANVGGANFGSACLFGADLSGARRLNASTQLGDARLCQTLLPGGERSDRDCERPTTCCGGGSGPTGPSGPSGPTCATCPTGASGPTGAEGPRGPRGESGETGPQGDPGESGPTGPTGAAGSGGATGPAGPTGPQGAQGESGGSGSSGAQGPTGPTGEPGATGESGPTGPIGEIGPQGDPGAPGATGPTGPAGSQGATGPMGSSGEQGSTGATGPTGDGNREMWVDVLEEQTWTNLGGGTLAASERHVVDLTNFTEVKMMAQVSVAGAGLLRVQWELIPPGGQFSTLVGFIDLSTTGVKQSDYLTIPGGARGLISIIAAASGGSGIGNNPQTRGVAIMVR